MAFVPYIKTKSCLAGKEWSRGCLFTMGCCPYTCSSLVMQRRPSLGRSSSCWYCRCNCHLASSLYSSSKCLFVYLDGIGSWASEGRRICHSSSEWNTLDLETAIYASPSSSQSWRLMRSSYRQFFYHVATWSLIPCAVAKCTYWDLLAQLILE